MAGRSISSEDSGEPYRISGTLTIMRAASTARELDLEPDPLTIDLSGVEKVDTVGAYIVHRAMRDRGATVTGASETVRSLLEQVAEADKPARVRPEEQGGFIGLLRELGEWVHEVGQTLHGMLAFFGATLIGFYNIMKRPRRRFRLNAVVQLSLIHI